MSWLDPLFQGISNLFINGVQTTKERGLNLIPGTGVTITYADNPAASRNDVTITSTGGGGGTVPTGTGFYAIVAGVAAAAARAVNLASSDVTGILAAANQAAQALAGTSVSGTTAAAVVLGVDGQPGGSAANATGATTLISGSTQTGTGSTGGDTTVGAGGGVLKSGNVNLLIGTTATGTEGQIGFYRGSVSPTTFIVGFRPFSNGAGMNFYMLPTGNTQTANNYLIQTDGQNAFWNTPAIGTHFFGVQNGLNYFSVNASQIQAGVPIVGFATNSSPYGAHGDVTAAFTTTTALIASQYAQDFFLVSPTAAMTLSGFPRAPATQGYSKKFQVTAAFAVTISDGTHSVVLPATIGMYIVEFTNAALYSK